MRTRKLLRRKGTRQAIKNQHLKDYLAAKRRGSPEAAGRPGESEVDPLSPTGRSAVRPATSGE